jgi:hypothetical protein
MWVDFRALNKTTNMIVEGDTRNKSLKAKQAPLHALTSYVFHLVIRYKKDIYDKVVNMLTRPIVSASLFLSIILSCTRAMLNIIL